MSPDCAILSKSDYHKINRYYHPALCDAQARILGNNLPSGRYGPSHRFRGSQVLNIRRRRHETFQALSIFLGQDSGNILGHLGPYPYKLQRT